MEVRIKKLTPNAVVPSYAKSGDAGLDLTATWFEYDTTGDIITYGTGLAVEIPEGFVGLLYSRSSIFKQDLIQSNCVGLIDSGYRGELMVKFRVTNDTTTPKRYVVGDKVAQLIIMPYPKVEFKLVTELGESERGKGGYGSTGK